MQRLQEIPDSLWRLFRSGNRMVYIEALLKINEEYQYNNYFLSEDVCLMVLGNYFAQKAITTQLLWQDDFEEDADETESPARRILTWLIKTKWLRRLEDYANGITNIAIPDYAAVFIEAFERLVNEDEDDTDIYIQNIYAILFSYKNDVTSGEGLLKTAMVNTRKLNKVLQDMLHNMDRFFVILLEQESYGDLLKEHLHTYVEEIVRKKYHILKTTDNFYLYKNNIRTLLKEIEEKENKSLIALERLADQLQEKIELAERKAGESSRALEEERDGEESEEKNRQAKLAEQQARKDAQELMLLQIEEKRLTARIKAKYQALAMLEDIERGFADMEKRISNMDKEHMKYIRATVTRLNYLLNEEENVKGLVIDLLGQLAEGGEERLSMAAEKMNFSRQTIVSPYSLYKRRGERKNFYDELYEQEDTDELGREEVLKLNRMKNRYSKKEIIDFVEEKMKGNVLKLENDSIQSEEDFEKLILAYDFSMRKESPFLVEAEEEILQNEHFLYPELKFVRK